MKNEVKIQKAYLNIYLEDGSIIDGVMTLTDSDLRDVAWDLENFLSGEESEGYTLNSIFRTLEKAIIEERESEIAELEGYFEDGRYFDCNFEAYPGRIRIN